MSNVERSANDQMMNSHSVVIGNSSFVISSALHFQQQDRHIDRVSYLVGRGAIKNVTNKPVTVRSHRDKIDIFLACQLDDLIRGFTKCEHSGAGETFCGQFRPASFQICPVLFHLFAFGELELIEVSGNPAISDVHKKQFRASHVRQRLDVCKNRLVGRSVLEWNENVVVHASNDKIRMTKLERMTKPNI